MATIKYFLFEMKRPHSPQREPAEKKRKLYTKKRKNIEGHESSPKRHACRVFVKHGYFHNEDVSYIT